MGFTLQTSESFFFLIYSKRNYPERLIFVSEKTHQTARLVVHSIEVESVLPFLIRRRRVRSQIQWRFDPNCFKTVRAWTWSSIVGNTFALLAFFFFFFFFFHLPWLSVGSEPSSLFHHVLFYVDPLANIHRTVPVLRMRVDIRTTRFKPSSSNRVRLLSSRSCFFFVCVSGFRSSLSSLLCFIPVFLNICVLLWCFTA